MCVIWLPHTDTDIHTHTLFSSCKRRVESLLQPACCLPDWPYAFGRRPVLCHQQTHCNCTLAINTGWESAGWEVIFTEIEKGSKMTEVMARIFQCPPAFSFEFPIWNICLITHRHTFSPPRSYHSPPRPSPPESTLVFQMIPSQNNIVSLRCSKKRSASCHQPLCFFLLSYPSFFLCF